jgi:hypothetical protein
MFQDSFEDDEKEQEMEELVDLKDKVNSFQQKTDLSEKQLEKY